MGSRGAALCTVEGGKKEGCGDFGPEVKTAPGTAPQHKNELEFTPKGQICAGPCSHSKCKIVSWKKEKNMFLLKEGTGTCSGVSKVQGIIFIFVPFILNLFY